MPTLAVCGAALFLLATMRLPRPVLRRVAMGWCVLSLLGLLGIWVYMDAAAENTSFTDQNNLRAGLLAVLVGLVAGLCAAVRTGRDTP